MGLKLKNDAVSRIAAGISSTDTTITLTTGSGTLFPVLSSGDYFPATLIKSDGSREIVRVTDRSADVFTVLRAQEGTVAQTFNANDKIELRLTAGAMIDLSQGVNIADASTSNRGLVQLTDSVESESTTTAATAKSVKLANDLAETANGTADAAMPKAGGTFTGGVTGLKADRQNTTDEGGQIDLARASDNATAWSVDVNGSGTTPVMRFVSASGVQMTLTSSGALTATGDVTAFSDERLKTNWHDVAPNFIELLAQVKAGSYERIDTGDVQAGVSAQSLRNALPQTVHSDENGTLSVAYGNAALVACVELAKEVMALRSELETMKRGSNGG